MLLSYHKEGESTPVHLKDLTIANSQAKGEQKGRKSFHHITHGLSWKITLCQYQAYNVKGFDLHAQSKEIQLKLQTWPMLQP